MQDLLRSGRFRRENALGAEKYSLHFNAGELKVRDMCSKKDQSLNEFPGVKFIKSLHDFI